MTRSPVIFLAVFSLLILSGCQTAGGVGPQGGVDTSADRRIVERLTAEEMKRCLNDEGFTDVTVDADNNVIVRMNGYRITAFLNESDHPLVRYYFAIAGTDATLEDLDEWNREAWFTKTYMDDEGDPVLEMVANLEGGVTRANLRKSILTYSQAHAIFLRDIVADENV